MLYVKPKKEALNILKKAHDKYNTTQEDMSTKGEELYKMRLNTMEFIENIQDLINSIAKTPKEFDVKVEAIQAEVHVFKKAEAYAQEAYENALKTSGSVAAGVAAGGAVATMAPTAAMWVATTFGTASTGTAISSLSGAVATKAALAWLGGGALSAGGAGVAGGQVLLALAGPIGWGIAGASTAISVGLMGNKNKKIAEEVMEEAKVVTKAGALLQELSAKMDAIHQETIALHAQLELQYQKLLCVQGCDYSTLSTETQIALGTLVNNTLTLAELLNKIIV